MARPPAPSTGPSVTLFVWGLIKACAAAGAPVRLPALERLVARGTVTRTSLSRPGWSEQHLGLLDALNLEPDCRHAVAPLEWLGQGGHPKPGSWMRADFVHVALGSGRASLQRIEKLAASDLGELKDMLAAHLQPAGIEVLTAPEQRASSHVYLHTPRLLDAVCPLPDYEEAEVSERLPLGRDGAELRRLFTEVQMLLHEHPVNTRRERGGFRAANALWLAGIGAMDSLQARTFPAICTNDPYARGLCVLHETACHELPQNSLELLPLIGHGLVAVLSTEPAVRSVADLQTFDRAWFEPLSNAVAMGRLPGIEILLDGWHIRIDRGALRRFWRRNRPLAELLF